METPTLTSGESESHSGPSTGADCLHNGDKACEPSSLEASSEKSSLVTTVSDRTKSLILQKISSNSPTSTTLPTVSLRNDVIHILTAEEAQRLRHQSEAKGPIVVIENVSTVASSTGSSNITCVTGDRIAAVPVLVTRHSNTPLTSVSPQTVTSISYSPSQDGVASFIQASPKGQHSPMARTAVVLNSALHVDRHQGQTTVTYKCEECEYYSNNKHYLKQHVDLVHSADRPYKCPFCDYAGKRSHALREHLIVHSSERPFECEHCNATFRKKGHLTNHVKLHTSQRLHKCPLCKELVTEQGIGGFDRHLKEVHNTEKLFGCDLCEFLAPNEPGIVEHVQTEHLNASNKVFKCKLCQFTTVDVNVYERHFQSHKQDLVCKQQVSETTTVKGPVSQTQPAVIKPVWIKCSECGFTGQDAEVIKQHMLKHIDEANAKAMVKAKPAVVSVQVASQSPSVNSGGIVIRATQPQLVHTVSKGTVSASSINPLSENRLIKMIPLSEKGKNSNLPVSKLVPQPILVSRDLSSLQQAKHVNMRLGISNTAVASASGQSQISVESSTNNTTLSTSSTSMISQPQIINITSEQFEKHLATECDKLSGNPQTNKRNTPEDATSTSLDSILTASPTKTAGAIAAIKVSLKKIPVPNFFPMTGPTTSAHLALDESQMEQEKDKKEELDLLRKRLANVQELIQQQEKIQRQTGDGKVKYLDSKGIPQTADMKNIVYYITPVSKQNTVRNPTNVGFTHDSTAGRFRCTICGYICEYQRTIKAHIWKHSGHKNIDYPMFQNGPLSIYEDTPLVEDDKAVSDLESAQQSKLSDKGLKQPLLQMNHDQPEGDRGPLLDKSTSSSLPPFIVYEQSKISNVAPALANLLAARTMVGLSDDRSEEKKDASVVEIQQKKLHPSEDIGPNTREEFAHPAGSSKSDITEKSRTVPQSLQTTVDSANVVVEPIDSLSNETRYTAMVSQQNSPRMAGRKSPDQDMSDSGISSEMASTLTDSIPDRSTKHNAELDDSNLLEEPRLVLDVDEALLDDAEEEHMEKESTEQDVEPVRRGVRRSRRVRSLEVSVDNLEEEPNKKRLRSSVIKDDSAVTLLSLLKKGPNYNPACPPSKETLERYSAPASPGQEDNSITSGANGSKPKSAGISSSLLAVIEQLRERSKSDHEEEKQPTLSSKKVPKRKSSRRSSAEEQTNAVDIDLANVEQFETEGETKYRCKLCHYKNESTALLRQHMRLHKTKQPFECSLCDFLAESSEALQDHMIQHCKVRTYQCKMCTSAFNYKSQLRAHMRAHNDQESQLSDYEANSPPSSRGASRGRSENKSYKCGTCKEEFITNFNLRIHRKEGCMNQNTDSIGNYSCTLCDFVAAGVKEIKFHLKSHNKGGSVPFYRKCYHCDFTSPSAIQLRQHIIEDHAAGVQRPMKCEKCGFTAVSVRSLKSHMKRHVNDQRFVQQPLEQYKCNLCGYVCHHLPSLKSHMWRHATDEQYSYEFTNDVINSAIDFDCHTDAQDTSQEDVEEFHQLIKDKMKNKGLAINTDPSEKTMFACCWVVFRCCQCGFETINKAELNVHMKSHSDVIKWTLEVPASSSQVLGRQAVAQMLEGPS